MKSKNIITIVLIFFFTFGLTSLAADTLAQLANHPSADYPLFARINWKEGPAPAQKLLPADAPGAQELRTRFTDYRPEITVEQFFTIPIPAGFSVSSLEEKRRLFTKVVNIFGNPQTQVGYTYYSSTRDKNISLFEDSYICDSRGKKQNAISYTAQNLPAQINYYQYIKEANFSGTIMSQSINTTPDYINIRTTNNENMRYSIIRIMDTGGMRTDLLVFPFENKLCVYYCTQIKKEPSVKQVFGVTIHLGLMFEKRMD